MEFVHMEFEPQLDAAVLTLKQGQAPIPVSSGPTATCTLDAG